MITQLPKLWILHSYQSCGYYTPTHYSSLRFRSLHYSRRGL